MEVMKVERDVKQVVRVRLFPIGQNEFVDLSVHENEKMRRYGPADAVYDEDRLAGVAESVYGDAPCWAVAECNGKWGVVCTPGTEQNGPGAVVLNAEETTEREGSCRVCFTRRRSRRKEVEFEKGPIFLRFKKGGIVRL